jgi:hypothetical protein
MLYTASTKETAMQSEFTKKPKIPFSNVEYQHQGRIGLRAFFKMMPPKKKIKR